MHFRNYGLKKRSHINVSKEPFQRTLRQAAHAQVMLKSTPQHFYHIDWSWQNQLSWKKSLLLPLKILALLVSTSTADEKYPVLNRDNLTIPIQMELSQKEKTFSEISDSFLNSILNFKHFEQKMMLIAFIFPNLPTPKTWLDKYLKGPVSEEVSTSNMAHVPKHSWNLHHSIVIIFIDHCEVNCVGKISLIDMQILGTAC